jgi:hypothetical protein
MPYCSLGHQLLEACVLQHLPSQGAQHTGFQQVVPQRAVGHSTRDSTAQLPQWLLEEVNLQVHDSTQRNALRQATNMSLQTNCTR